MQRHRRFLSLLTALPLYFLLASTEPPMNAGQENASGESAGQIRKLAQAPSFRSPDGLAIIRPLLEPAEPGSAYLGHGTFLPGAGAPNHRHPESEEILYILSGQGTMTLGGKQIDVSKDMAIRIPAGVEHAFRVTGKKAIELVQVYRPAGPEQRFKRWNREPAASREKKRP